MTQGQPDSQPAGGGDGAVVASQTVSAASFSLAEHVVAVNPPAEKASAFPLAWRTPWDDCIVHTRTNRFFSFGPTLSPLSALCSPPAVRKARKKEEKKGFSVLEKANRE